MGKITLRDLNNEISSLITRGQHEQAISSCTSILEQFPDCLRTTTHLAEALMQSHNYEEASPVLSKLLEILPDDKNVLIGMSKIQSKNLDFSTAIENAEKAFDQNPADPEIQDYLRYLKKNLGTTSFQLTLSPAALALQKSRKGLIGQSIIDLKIVLNETPNRIDLKVLLGKLLSQSGATIDSKELCENILIDSPLCYEANRILYELASEEEKADSVFRKNLTSLDPYYQYVGETYKVLVDVPDDKILMDVPELTSTPEIDSVEIETDESRDANSTDPEIDEVLVKNTIQQGQSQSDWMEGSGWTRLDTSIAPPPLSFADHEQLEVEKNPPPPPLPYQQPENVQSEPTQTQKILDDLKSVDNLDMDAIAFIDSQANTNEAASDWVKQFEPDEEEKDINSSGRSTLLKNQGEDTSIIEPANTSELVSSHEIQKSEIPSHEAQSVQEIETESHLNEMSVPVIKVPTWVKNIVNEFKESADEKND